jgi:hypothetical protein
MSVLSEIIEAITAADVEAFEGTVDQVLREKPKYSRFAAVIEESGEVETPLDTRHYAEVRYTLSITTYVRKPSLQEAWEQAREMRDTIIDTIESQRFDDMDVMIDRWERDDRDGEALEAGYEITIYYTRVHEP